MGNIINAPVCSAKTIWKPDIRDIVDVDNVTSMQKLKISVLVSDLLPAPPDLCTRLIFYTMQLEFRCVIVYFNGCNYYHLGRYLHIVEISFQRTHFK